MGAEAQVRHRGRPIQAEACPDPDALPALAFWVGAMEGGGDCTLGEIHVLREGRQARASVFWPCCPFEAHPGAPVCGCCPQASSRTAPGPG